MKKLFCKKYGCILGVGILCLAVYLPACLIIPPLLGTQKKSDAQPRLPAPAQERVCLVDGNEEALSWRLRLIGSAQEEIILSTFDFRADNSGSDIISALMDAAQRGVRVRVLVDGMNAQLHINGSSAFKALAAQENAEIKFYNPIRLTRLWTANYRCHDKYLIVDRNAYIIGGRNTSDLFLGSGGTSRQNEDRDVVVYGDGSDSASVRTLLSYFEEIWALDTSRSFEPNGESGAVRKARTELAERWAGLHELEPIDWDAETVWAEGVSVLHSDCTAWNKSPQLLNALTELMQGGSERVVLQTPYIICNQSMYDCLEKAAGGEAVMQIITNSPQSGANPWGCADLLNNEGRILATGVFVCQWSGENSMHTKTILIDDRLSVIGSFNWDMRSAYLDTEMMLLVDCPELNSALREETDTMLRQGKTLAPDGSVTQGADYAPPEASILKTAVQGLVRIVIRPFRYLL